MRMVRVEVQRVDLQLARPYTIAYETIDHVENLLVRLVTDGPHVGLGVAAPDPGVTGETVEGALALLTGPVRERLLASDPLRRLPVVEGLLDDFPRQPSVRAAVDIALFDLLGKAAGLPVWRLLGGYRPSIRTSITIFLGPVDEVVEEAVGFVARGFTALKIKGGVGVDEDVERLIRVREAVGPGIELRFDANQGYTLEQARALHRRTRDVGLALFEQPTPAAERQALRAVTSALPLPVMADESLLSLTDAFLLARGEMSDMINIKLAKVGGIDTAGLINGVARAAGLEVMVGCTDEAALSIAAGLAFALSRRNVEYADLDGHLDFVADPTAGCVRLESGVLYPSEDPGFGLVDVPSGT